MKQTRLKIKDCEIKAIVLDMDGVITETESLHEEAGTYACAHHGIIVPNEAWIEFKGRPDMEVFAIIIERYAKMRVSVSHLICTKTARYLEIAPSKMRLVSGSVEFIKFIRPHLSGMGLATSSFRAIQKLVFDTYCLDEYFTADAVIAREDVDQGKPHPEPYYLAMKKLGLNSGKGVAVIEDSLSGVASARSAQCELVIGITTSFTRQELLECGAHKVVGSFDELRKCCLVSG